MFPCYPHLCVLLSAPYHPATTQALPVQDEHPGLDLVIEDADQGRCLVVNSAEGPVRGALLHRAFRALPGLAFTGYMDKDSQIAKELST